MTDTIRLARAIEAKGTALTAAADNLRFALEFDSEWGVRGAAFWLRSAAFWTRVQASVARIEAIEVRSQAARLSR